MRISSNNMRRHRKVRRSATRRSATQSRVSTTIRHAVKRFFEGMGHRNPWTGVPVSWTKRPRGHVPTSDHRNYPDPEMFGSGAPPL